MTGGLTFSATDVTTDPAIDSKTPLDLASFLALMFCIKLSLVGLVKHATTSPPPTIIPEEYRTHLTISLVSVPIPLIMANAIVVMMRFDDNRKLSRRGFSALFFQFFWGVPRRGPKSGAKSGPRGIPGEVPRGIP